MTWTISTTSTMVQQKLVLTTKSRQPLKLLRISQPNQPSTDWRTTRNTQLHSRTTSEVPRERVSLQQHQVFQQQSQPETVTRVFQHGTFQCTCTRNHTDVLVSSVTTCRTSVVRQTCSRTSQMKVFQLNCVVQTIRTMQ